ncbi:ribosome-associated GTPase EngA, partial [Vibrio parahaemolyticus V-223/04]
SKTQT